MRDCFDEATVQAYLDGELSPDRAVAVAAHLGECGVCNAAAREAARQLAMFTTAFGAGDGLSVPTERLRAGIEARIAEMQPTTIAQPNVCAPTFVERLRGFASSLAFAPRQATAFASFALAVVLLGALFYAFRQQARSPQISQNSESEIAAVNPPVNRQGNVIENGDAGTRATNKTITKDDESSRASNEIARGGETRTRRGADRATMLPLKFNPRRDAGDAAVGVARTNDEKMSDAALLPVEKSYVTAIASLKSSIDGAGAQSLTPTLRAEYERNLAVVDHAIAASRAEARRTPADKDAQDFLRSAYQDKLDLLHAVADQTQLASITR
jgi:hypothetical protein